MTAIQKHSCSNIEFRKGQRISDKQLYSLRSFINEVGIPRVGGRLENAIITCASLICWSINHNFLLQIRPSKRNYTILPRMEIYFSWDNQKNLTSYCTFSSILKIVNPSLPYMYQLNCGWQKCS